MARVSEWRIVTGRSNQKYFEETGLFLEAIIAEIIEHTIFNIIIGS